MEVEFPSKSQRMVVKYFRKVTQIKQQLRDCGRFIKLTDPETSTFGIKKSFKQDLWAVGNGSLPIDDSFATNAHSVENNTAETAVEKNEGKRYAKEVLNLVRNKSLYISPNIERFKPLMLHDLLFGAGKKKLRSIQSFMQYMTELANVGLFEHLYNVTMNAYKSQLWVNAQHMRLRCSLIYQVAIRKDSSDDRMIVNSIFYADRVVWMEEKQILKRHKRYVLKKLKTLGHKHYNMCGLILHENYPFMCASPDAIASDYIIEIKIPITMEEFESFLKGGEVIPQKYMAQLQIQMHFAKVSKALYCVQNPNFDLGEKIHYIWVMANEELVSTLLNAAEQFWKNVVFVDAHKL